MTVRVQMHPRRKVSGATALVPAAARPIDVLTDEETRLNLEAVETFTQAVGGRDALIDVLSIADTAPDVDRVVTLLIDPRYAKLPLKKVCYLAGLTVADLFAAYKKALITRAHIQATHIVAAKLPPIIEDVMNRATPTPIVCPVCHAHPDDRQVCALCRGTGAVLSEPDLDRQKLALELGQLTEKKGGFVITQNQGLITNTQLTAVGTGALEQLQQVVGDLLYTSAEVPEEPEQKPEEEEDDDVMPGDLPHDDEPPPEEETPEKEAS